MARRRSSGFHCHCRCSIGIAARSPAHPRRSKRRHGRSSPREARAEIERTRATFASRRETLATVKSDVLQRVPTLRRMAEDAYRERRGSILELLDASRSLKDIQLLHVKQLELSKLAEEAVVAAAGLDADQLP
jgi:outer membrane protein, heavy metal efflux system